MKLNKTYTIHIEGDWNINCDNPERIERAIQQASSNIADLINDNLPTGLIAVCKEVK